jgi:hypothetical protein
MMSLNIITKKKKLNRFPWIGRTIVIRCHSLKRKASAMMMKTYNKKKVKKRRKKSKILLIKKKTSRNSLYKIMNNR